MTALLGLFRLDTVGKRFLVPTIALLVVLLGTLGFILIRQSNTFATTMMNTRGDSMANFLENVGSTYVNLYNVQAIDGLVEQAMRDPDIKYVMFLDDEDKPITEKFLDTKEPTDATGLLPFNRELKNVDGEKLGMLKLLYSGETLALNTRNQLFYVLAGILVTLGVFIGGIVWLTGGVTGPLSRLLTVVEGVAAGNLSIRAQVEKKDEVGNLAQQVNNMIDNLRRLIGQISNTAVQVNQVSEQIAKVTESITSGAQTQARAADETSSSMEEMSANIQGVAKNAESMASTTEQTASSIQELGATAEAVAKNAQVMSENVSSTSSTIEQMLVTLASIAKNVAEADQLSQRARNEATSGGEAVMKTVSGMKNISEMMKNISRVIENLGERSEAIGGIVEVIEEIADQTNLLALNAAIEAARAGSAGKGFAVVADEVRKLAERSIKATKEIAEVITQVQKETSAAVRATEEGARRSEEGITLADRAGAAIAGIVEAVNSVSGIMAQVSEATQEQSIAANTVIKAVENVNRLTAAVTDSTREQVKGVQQVVEASEIMTGMTVQVKDATVEQKKAGELVVKAVENIGTIARTNLAAAEQLAATAKAMMKQSDGLQEAVRAFRIA